MRRLALALALCLAPLALAAQELGCDPGDLEIRSVDFIGNTHYSDGTLEAVIVTSPSSWFRRHLGLPFGRRRCLDTLELRRDGLRLRAFYRVRGYFHTTVSPELVPQGVRAVNVDFRIKEGPPVLIDSLAISGLDSVRNHAQLLRPFDQFRHHHIYNQVELQARVDSTVERLHNTGYPYTDLHPLTNDQVDTVTNRATIERTFVYTFRGQTQALPAHVSRIGTVTITVGQGSDSAKISPSTIRRLLSFKPGRIYRERDLLRSERDLFQLETYRHVSVDLAPDSLQPSDTSVTVAVDVTEGKMNSLRLGVGWATLDCARTQGRLTNRNFLGGAKRLELTGRLSRIALCPSAVRNDPISDVINYYGSGTLRLPTLFGPRNVPSLTLFSERTSEYRAYLRETPIGGAAEVTRDLRPNFLRPGLPLTLSYRLEFGRTKADAAVFCQLFNRCSLSDIARLQQNGRLGVFSATLVRDRSDNLLDPARGSVFRVELHSGSTSVDTARNATRFNRAFTEGAIYVPVGSSVVAARLQLGTVLEGWSLQGATAFVPPEERLYAGGPNSVRGYNQNLLGPLVYIVTDVDSSQFAGANRLYVAPDSARVLQYSPTGGNTLVVGNLEWRVRPPILNRVLQVATFIDAGLVWNRPKETVSLNDLRVTPGVGLRVESPIGPLRVDVAYNRYTSAKGAAYYLGSDKVLRCVSPGNTFDRGLVPPDQECSSTFSPLGSNNFLSRLVFHFSIGQAF